MIEWYYVFSLLGIFLAPRVESVAITVVVAAATARAKHTHKRTWVASLEVE